MNLQKILKFTGTAWRDEEYESVEKSLSVEWIGTYRKMEARRGLILIQFSRFISGHSQKVTARFSLCSSYDMLFELLVLYEQ